METTGAAVSSDFVMEGFINHLQRKNVSGDTRNIPMPNIFNRPETGIKDANGEWVDTVERVNSLLEKCLFFPVDGYCGRFAETTLLVEAQLPEGYAAYPAYLPTTVIPAVYLDYIRHCRMYDKTGRARMSVVLDICDPPDCSKPWHPVLDGRVVRGENPVPASVMLNFNKITLKFNTVTKELVYWFPGREKYIHNRMDPDVPWVLLGVPYTK